MDHGSGEVDDGSEATSPQAANFDAMPSPLLDSEMGMDA
jgi:hypothetical protein